MLSEYMRDKLTELSKEDLEEAIEHIAMLKDLREGKVLIVKEFKNAEDLEFGVLYRSKEHVEFVITKGINSKMVIFSIAEGMLIGPIKLDHSWCILVGETVSGYSGKDAYRWGQGDCITTKLSLLDSGGNPITPDYKI